MKNTQDFSNFGDIFQEKLALIILIDRAFADQMQEVLDFDFFDKKFLKVFVKLIFSYREKYEVHPTMDIINTLIKTELKGQPEFLLDEIKTFFSRCQERDRVSDEDFVKEKSLDFCKKQKIKFAMLRSLEFLETSKFDDIRIEIEESLKLGSDNNHGHKFIQDFETRYLPNYRNPVSTGWKLIDGYTEGGLGKGELGVVIAATGKGKSLLLVHLGAKALLSGINVVHYTLELSPEVIGRRYDACLTKIPLNELSNHKDLILEEIKKVPGKLIVKEFPQHETTVNQLERHIEKIKMDGGKIDMIIVDYGDLLKSSRSYEQKRNELGAIYSEMRNLSKKFNCPIWTASQTNRSGLNAEIVTMESISEAYEKCFVADFICSLSRTVEDEKVNSGRIFIAKNRNGVTGRVFPIIMNTGIVHVDVLSDLEAESQIPTSKSVMAEKFKKFVKARGTDG